MVTVTVVMTLLFVLEGVILTIMAIVTGQDVWALDGDEYLLVTYGTGGKVKEAEFVIP